jgi:3-dehydroquinate synthase
MKYTVIETQKEIPIYSGENISKNLGDYLSKVDFDKIMIITDSNVFKLWKNKLAENLKKFEFDFFVFKAGEKAKNFKNYYKLCNDILDKGITKKSMILAFGGGVVGNIAGFVAATLFRGIKLIHVPTTIMAQADSTSGGKQAINSKHGKNTIGTFYEPEFILIDSKYLETLPEREIKCGIAECIKHALCQDKKLLEKLSQKNLDKVNLLKIIKKTIQLKIDVIEIDRKEINEGKILVYGHTIGHAIETLAKGKLNHGESISIGMCCVAKVSYKL